MLFIINRFPGAFPGTCSTRKNTTTRHIVDHQQHVERTALPTTAHARRRSAASPRICIHTLQSRSGRTFLQHARRLSASNRVHFDLQRTTIRSDRATSSNPNTCAHSRNSTKFCPELRSRRRAQEPPRTEKEESSNPHPAASTSRILRLSTGNGIQQERSG